MQISEERRTHIDSYRENLVNNYRQVWADMIAEWSFDDPSSKGWMMYSANYLFRTANVRWAVDPFLLSTRVLAPFWEQQIIDLSKLDFVLLTHRHNDHFDRTLVHALRNYPIRWLIPQEMLADVLALEVDPHKITIAHPGKPIRHEGIQVVPFVSLHFQVDSENRVHGVPETGYLVEINGKRWLLPGDVRNYKAEQLPQFGPVDLLISHLWLGRKSAETNPPPLLDQFCEFCLALNPSQIVITHLYELGRKPDNLWSLSHFQIVKNKFAALIPDIKVSSALTGQKIQI